MRDIATYLIGKESTVPAFGFAFYTPKELRREERAPIAIGASFGDIGLYGLYKAEPTQGTHIFDNALYSSPKKSYDELSRGIEISFQGRGIKMSSQGRDIAEEIRIMECRAQSILEEKKVKEVSVGAGAKISQFLSKDKYPLESWKETPDAVMTIYFVFQDKFEELKSGGMKDLSGVPEGMLDGLPVG